SGNGGGRRSPRLNPPGAAFALAFPASGGFGVGLSTPILTGPVGTPGITNVPSSLIWPEDTIPALPLTGALPATTGLPLLLTLPVTSVFDGPHPADRPPSAKARATSPDRRTAGRASARMDGLLGV